MLVEIYWGWGKVSWLVDLRQMLSRCCLSGQPQSCGTEQHQNVTKKTRKWYRRPAQTRSQLTSHDRLHSGLPRSVFPRLPGSGRYSHTRSVQEGELLFSSGWWLQLAIHVWCLIIFEKKCSWELGKRKALGRRKVCTWKWYFLFSSTQYIKQNIKYKIQM